MLAFAIAKYTDPLTMRDMPDPQPGPGEVVGAVAATSVNPFEAKLHDETFKALLPMPMPLITVAGDMSLSWSDA